MVRLAAVACNTGALLHITFGTIGRGEPAYAAGLVADLHPGMLLLADRNFAAALAVAYQALRIAIPDATLAHPGLDPDRGSFSIALDADLGGPRSWSRRTVT